MFLCCYRHHHGHHPHSHGKDAGAARSVRDVRVHDPGVYLLRQEPKSLFPYHSKNDRARPEAQHHQAKLVFTGTQHMRPNQ